MHPHVIHQNDTVGQVGWIFHARPGEAGPGRFRLKRCEMKVTLGIAIDDPLDGGVAEIAHTVE